MTFPREKSSSSASSRTSMENCYKRVNSNERSVARAIVDSRALWGAIGTGSRAIPVHMQARERKKTCL
ncbi:unnamed protein product [Trichogramma brassicae]|uniref:Uncharacterized protein n=1 Tax=Trichogramma brassicae TaxID=86971 RepID=A0A6H5HU74_9HYME|nr:unnamed protein product [Trichogramma brassicae]